MISIIGEPIWKKLCRKKKINDVKKKLQQAKNEGDNIKVTVYEAELMLLSMEDYVIH